MTKGQYNRLYDEIEATIKGSAVAMNRAQKEKVVRDVMSERGVHDPDTCESLIAHFGEKVL